MQSFSVSTVLAPSARQRSGKNVQVPDNRVLGYPRAISRPLLHESFAPAAAFRERRPKLPLAMHAATFLLMCSCATSV